MIVRVQEAHASKKPSARVSCGAVRRRRWLRQTRLWSIMQEFLVYNLTLEYLLLRLNGLETKTITLTPNNPSRIAWQRSRRGQRDAYIEFTAGDGDDFKAIQLGSLPYKEAWKVTHHHQAKVSVYSRHVRRLIAMERA